MKDRPVKVFAPASLSNLGPGFDTMGLAFTGPGDTIVGRLTRASGIVIESNVRLPAEPERNTAGRAARAVLRQAKADCGLHLTIHKGIPLGSGVGGSAASAAAGAWTANLLLGRPFSKEDLVDAVLDGESAASGGIRHGDNALPALFGGLILTSPVRPGDYRRIKLQRSMHLVVLLPALRILTKAARRALPTQVDFREYVHNASDLAFMLHALLGGDWARLGPYLMRDRFVEPVRARQVAAYGAIREAALNAGAHAAALTGSGPAMFAVAPDEKGAEIIKTAMIGACDVSARAYVTEVDSKGVRSCP